MTSNNFAELITNLYDIKVIRLKHEVRPVDHFHDSGVRCYV